MSALPLGGEDDRGPGAGDAPDPVQRADGGLQSRDVGNPHLEHVTLAAGHAPAVLDAGCRPQRLLDAGVVDRVALDDADERRDVQSDGRGIDDRLVSEDYPGRLELADPLVHGRRREPPLTRELRVAGPAVGAQQVDELPVHGVDDGLRPAGAGGDARRPLPSIPADVHWGRTRGWMPVAAFLVVLLVAVGVVVLLMRAAAAAGNGGVTPPRPPRMRPTRPRRPIAPDDDPDFLRELDRRRSSDEGPGS